ncbi:MAG: regulator SirB [Gammaproteobacteria bacterium]|nr:MAG: regulator SirB [Gammaproteobacteria bacterium]
MFLVVKSIHLLTVALTITGFIIRGTWMIQASPLLEMRAVRTFPHVNDTLLLISALWTAAMVGQYPFINGWLTAKVIGAIAYILLGAVALTYGPTRQIRVLAFIGSLLCFTYVVTVAITKNPLLF